MKVNVLFKLSTNSLLVAQSCEQQKDHCKDKVRHGQYGLHYTTQNNNDENPLEMKINKFFFCLYQLQQLQE